MMRQDLLPPEPNGVMEGLKMGFRIVETVTSACTELGGVVRMGEWLSCVGAGPDMEGAKGGVLMMPRYLHDCVWRGEIASTSGADTMDGVHDFRLGTNSLIRT